MTSRTKHYCTITSVQYTKKKKKKKKEPICTITSVLLLIFRPNQSKGKIIIIIYKYNIIENNFSLNVVWHNIFPYRPDEVAMLGCESLSTTKLFHCSVFREVTYT